MADEGTSCAGPRLSGGASGVTTQYFELSPRHSLESPPRKDAKSRMFADSPGIENVNRNIPSNNKQCKKTLCGSPGNASIDYTRQPCLRPRSPVQSSMRAETPPKKRGGGGAETPQPSYRRVETPRTRAAETPHSRSVCGGLEDEESVANFSVHSVESRLTQLSRRSSSKKILSSQELEYLAVEEARQKLKEQTRRNEVSLRKALSGSIGAVTAATGRGECSLKVTIPKEFAFSGRTRTRSQSTEIKEESEHVKQLDGKNSRPSTPKRTASSSSSSSAPCATLTRSQTAPHKWRPHLQVHMEKSSTSTSQSGTKPDMEQPKKRSSSQDAAQAAESKFAFARPRSATPRASRQHPASTRPVSPSTSIAAAGGGVNPSTQQKPRPSDDRTSAAAVGQPSPSTSGAAAASSPAAQQKPKPTTSVCNRITAAERAERARAVHVEKLQGSRVAKRSAAATAAAASAPAAASAGGRSSAPQGSQKARI